METADSPKLNDILDVKNFQAMLDDFYSLTNIGIGIIDLDGNVLVATGWQDICTKFHRIHPVTCQNCVESDTVLSDQVDPGVYKSYKCKNNLWDISTPIMIGSKHVGNIFLGQFFYDDEVPDREYFIHQANQYGFDELEYLEALDRVPRWSRTRVDTVMRFYTRLAHQISSLGYSKIQLENATLAANQLIEQLKISEAHLKEAHQLAKLGHWEFDPETMNQTWSEETFNILEIDTSVGEPKVPEGIDLIDPEFRPIAQNAIEKAIIYGEPFDQEWVVTTAKGNKKWVRLKATVRRENGITKSVAGSFQDITDFKNLEDEIRKKNEQLLATIAEKDKFFSIIAHDLKSPFNAIIGLSELLTEQVMEQDCEGIIRSARIIQQSSNKAMALLTNLMDWTRSQSGRMEFNPEPIEMSSLCEEVLALFQESAVQKGIVVRTSFKTTAKLFVDRNMMSTVVRNLISNAIKFSYSGGTVDLILKETVDSVKLQVEDHGIGIPANRVETLFKIDEAISTRGTSNETGTGLGLILCMEFIKKHKGELTVQSTENEGTTFNVILPITA